MRCHQMVVYDCRACALMKALVGYMKSFRNCPFYCLSGFHRNKIHSSGNVLLKSLLLPVLHVIIKIPVHPCHLLVGNHWHFLSDNFS